MSITTIVADVKATIATLNAADFQEVMYWIVSDEKKRRESETVVQAARVQMVREAREADPASAPIPDEDGVLVWREPGNIFGAYLPDEVVTHDGAVWRSVCDHPNLSEPGVDTAWAKDAPEAAEQAEVDPEPTPEPVEPENGAKAAA